MSPDSAEMPKYAPRQVVVRALKIGKIVMCDGGATITPTDERFAPIGVNTEYMRQKPCAGGYYVVKANGHKVFVEGEEFEAEWLLL